MNNFTIKLDDKPHLTALLKSDAQLAKEVIATFVELMEEACANDWQELPKKFGPDMTFRDLVKGILRGSLQLPDINPNAYPALKEEVHPLSMMMPRMNFLDGTMRYANWRNHFRLEPEEQVNAETIAKIFRRLLRYYKYVDVEALAHALINKQVKTFEGLGSRNIETLPYYPALRYQQETFGDLQVGKFLDDIGSFDCGSTTHDYDCPACKRHSLKLLGRFKVCMDCNAGFTTEE